MTGQRLASRFLGPVAAGLLVAASVPPWGLWPAAFAGVAVLDSSLAGRSARSRLGRGILAGAAWALPSTFWMVDLTPPGWVVAALLHAGFVGLAAVAVPPLRGRRPALVGALTLAEFARWSVPFGGVPLATIPIGQAAGPLAPVVRVAGPLLLVVLVAATGCALSALADAPRAPGRFGRSVAGAGGVVAVALLLATLAPTGKTVGTIEAAVVQGGGPQRTRATPTGAVIVFANQVAATDLVTGPVDLVVWPENVVNPDPDLPNAKRHPNRLYADEARSVLEDLAGSLDAVLVAGWFHRDPTDQGVNLNYVEAIEADGHVADRFDKVRTVPFGEFVPLRGLVERFAADSLPRRDVRPGDGPAVLDTSLGRLGVAISWEVFFTERTREAALHDALVLLNPTNGASYWLTQIQTQQVASSRLRALETGRWLLQAAPTGFSAIIDPEGKVLDRTGVGEQAVRQATVGLRNGQTWATRVGPWPMLAAALVLVVWGRWPARRRED